MLNLRICYLAGIVICSTSIGLGFARADAESHRNAAEELLKLSSMEKMVQRSIDNMVVIQLRQNPGLAEHEDLMRSFLEKYIGWETMKDEIAEMYIEAFTEQELKEINAFYRKPVGQKVIRVVPDLIVKRARLATQRVQEHRDELEKQLAERSEQPLEKITE